MEVVGRIERKFEVGRGERGESWKEAVGRSMVDWGGRGGSDVGVGGVVWGVGGMGIGGGVFSTHAVSDVNAAYHLCEVEKGIRV